MPRNQTQTKSALENVEGQQPVKSTRLSIVMRGSPLQFEWAATISQDEWTNYKAAVQAVRAAGVPFMLGGGFALAAFTGRWRDTKDIDFYINPEDRDAAVQALASVGFEDYYSRLAYDRKWIFRSTRSGVIVDIIWSMANQRAQVDSLWFEHAGSLKLRDLELLIVPREEFMWCKLYIMQRDHCDWTDLFNLLYAGGADIDWEHLVWRLDRDTPLLKGLLNVYAWLCPQEIPKLPPQLWSLLEMSPPPIDPEPPDHDRLRLLDSRCWFAASKKPGEKLEV